MALLERVSTLVRANLNDLIDKAEEPEKMIKQVILDMQNQLLQVKTQVAIAIAAHHATDAHSGMSSNAKSATFDRMKRKVIREEAVGQAKAELLADDVEDRLAALEKEDRIEQLLTELKTKRGA